jgi:hypothetical protein
MQIRPYVLLSLLFALTLPVQATLVPGSEKGVTAPVPDVAAFGQDLGRIASNGDSFLAVWIDLSSSDVHGARVTAEGKREDDDVLPIAVTEAHETQVAVAFGAGRYLVVWSAETVLRGRFVAPDGTMSDPFDIAPLADPFRPQVVFNGHRFLVMWPTGPAFRGALVDMTGGVLKTFDIAPTAQTNFQPTIAAAGGTFQFVSSITDPGGVPYDDGYPGDVGVTPIDENGTVGTRVLVAPPETPVLELRAVSSGDGFALAWSTAVRGPGGTVRAVQVTPAGAGAIESIPSEGMYLHDVGADSGGGFVIYGNDSTKYLRRLGSGTSDVVVTPATPTTVLDVASNGARTLVLVRGNPRVGYDFGAAGGDLYVTRLDTREIEPLVLAPRHQSLPDVAAAGDLRLAVWCEYIGSERRLGIVGSRLDAAGNALDLSGIDLHVSLYAPVGARVASNGTDWLVTWADTGTLYGTRIAHDGTPIDMAPVQLASHVYSNDVAVSWDGTQYVVVFSRGYYFHWLNTSIHAVRVPAQSTGAVSEVTLATISTNEWPAIASGPEGSLVTWRGGGSLRGALLSRTGTVTPLGFPAGILSPPTVAWNEGTFLVAAGFRGSLGDEIQWLLVSDTGVVRTPLSPFVDLALGSNGGSSSLELEPYADGFLLYWNPTANDTVYAARISGEGVLTDPPKAIATTLGSYLSLRGYLRSLGAAGNLVVYARRIGHPTRETARVFSRVVQSVAGQPRRRAVR